MKRNRTVLLVVAAALVAAGVLSSRCADEAKDPAEREAKAEAKARADKVVFPRDVRRRRGAPVPTAEGTAPAKRSREAGADPIQRAMAFKDGGAVFVEVNAIRHSDLAQKLLACRKDEALDAMQRFKEQIGVDPLEEVDRIALHEEVFAASGFFDELKLPPEAGEPESYGDDSQLYRMPHPDDPSKVTVVGKVQNGLLLLGEDEAQVKAAVDRAEGRGDDVTPLPPEVTGTEIYGRFGPELLGQLLGGGLSGGAGEPLMQRVAEIVTDGTVRVLVDDAVSMSLDLKTNDAAGGEDLAKALGGALAGARQQAESEGNEELAALLDKARVLKQDNGSFGIDLAVPGDTLLEAMGCKDGATASEGAAMDVP